MHTGKTEHVTQRHHTEANVNGPREFDTVVVVGSAHTSTGKMDAETERRISKARA